MTLNKWSFEILWGNVVLINSIFSCSHKVFYTFKDNCYHFIMSSLNAFSFDLFYIFSFGKESKLCLKNRNTLQAVFVTHLCLRYGHFLKIVTWIFDLDIDRWLSTWCQRKQISKRNKQVKYESSIMYHSKIMINIKVFWDQPTMQKLYATDLLMWRHNNCRKRKICWLYYQHFLLSPKSFFSNVIKTQNYRVKALCSIRMAILGLCRVPILYRRYKSKDYFLSHDKI